MQGFLVNVLLALVWAALHGRFTTTNLLTGFVLGYLVISIAPRGTAVFLYVLKVRMVLRFVVYFFKELFVANLRVARRVLASRRQLRPAVVAVPLDARTDVEITLLASVISLTPGSLSLDVSTDRKVLYIHALDAGDVARFRLHIKHGFERRLLDVLR